MITVEVNGNRYSGFLDVEVGMSMAAISRDFSMTIAAPTPTSIIFRGGESIKIYVNSSLVLDGFVDEAIPTYSKNDHTVLVVGRSKAGDLVDSSLTPMTIAAGTSLPDAISQVIAQLGLSIGVVNEISSLRTFTVPEDILGAEPSDNAFDFIDTLARKRQALLTSDASGNIVITRNNPITNEGSLVNKFGGVDGNIISASASYSKTNRFNKYVVMSQGNAAASFNGGNFDPAEFVDMRGEQIDSEIRSGRQLVIQAEKSSTSAESKKRATWQANIAKANSRKYTVTLAGVTSLSGGIWQFNTLQRVNDEQCGIQDILLIESVRFKQTKFSGTITQLGLVDKNSYEVLLSEPLPMAKRSNDFAEFN